MKGFEVRSNLEFERLFQPLLPRFASLYWYLNFYQGPWNSRWLNDEAHFRQVEQYHVSVAGLPDISDAVWRPGVLPRFASRLCFDEWDYMTGFDPEPGEIARTIKAFTANPGGVDETYYRLVQEIGKTLIINVAGWWEIYCADPEWAEELDEVWFARGIQHERINSVRWRSKWR